MDFPSRSAAPLSANLLSHVYATVGREDLWPTAMEALCTEFCAAGVAIRNYDFLLHTCHDLHCCPHLCSVEAPVLARPPLGTVGWREADRRFQNGNVVLGANLTEKSGKCSDPSYSAEEELLDAHILHGVLSRTRWHAQVISVERSMGLPAFDAGAKKLLGQLLAHLYQARSLGQNIEAQLHERSAFIAVLQHVPLACFLVNQQSYVRFFNKAAAEMLGGGELRIVADRLCGRSAKTSSLLWRAVSHAAANGGMNHEASLALPLDTEGSPLVLKLCPVREDAGHSSYSEALVAVVAKDPMGATFSSIGRLSEIYGLTPAESRLVGCLSKQAGLFEAAGKIGISRNTARTHMRHIYAKLNVHCQADLMRLLSRCGML